MNGRNKFDAIITVADIVAITDKLNSVNAEKYIHILNYDDLQTAIVIDALSAYLEEQGCPPGFKIDLNK